MISWPLMFPFIGVGLVYIGLVVAIVVKIWRKK